LWGINRDKKRLGTPPFGVLYNALRRVAVFVDVSLWLVSKARENKFEVDGRVQLEKLHLTWLSGIDQLVERTGRQSRYLSQLFIN
jgi:hypothetical protein